MGGLRIAGLAFSVALAAAGSSLAATTLSGAHGNVSPSCPVTLPNHVLAPGQGTKADSYSNGGLWVELWPYGVTLVRKGDVTRAGLGVKIPWYRYTAGRLRITAVRLDGPAPRPTVHVPSGYGLKGFQSSAVYFPVQGCWRVSGTAGRSHLTFVTVVMTAATLRQEVPNG